MPAAQPVATRPAPGGRRAVGYLGHRRETSVKRNRFIQLSGGTTTINRDLEAKGRELADLKGDVTNLAACPKAPR